MKRKIGFALAILAVYGMMFYGAIEVYASGFEIPIPVASGVSVSSTATAEIDYSNARDGYVMARFTGTASAQARVMITTPRGVQYQYRLNTNGTWEVFPLSGGNGEYTIGVFEPVEGNRFAVANRITINVILANEFAPFLRPNQFVNFNRNSSVVTLANRLAQGSSSTLETVGIVYQYVIDNIEYDFQLAATVQSGYVPDLEEVLRRRRGICFDFASLMTAMLRSQGIPTQLVIGYVGDVFHAWISVHTPETGWINNIISFDGRTWQIMDPTFAATSNQSEEFLNLIGDGQSHQPTNLH
ncbi:MAG: transglutaminase-like domain-containing protein [Defluviitaleaceae bacterium]|nr:transglutaminase-like domain-containing protein [Defluviitaleaceae bacterium]